MVRNRPAYILILVFLILLPLSELIFSNLGILVNPGLRTTLAQQFGLSDAQENLRLIILSLLDIVAATGGAVLLFALVRLKRRQTLTVGQWWVLLGYSAYGLYQIIAGLTIIAPTFRGVVVSGVFYICLGILGYLIGRQVRLALRSAL